MSNETKLKVMSVISVAGVTACVILGVFAWQNHQQITALQESRQPTPLNHFTPGLSTDPFDPMAEFAKMQKQMDQMMQDFGNDQSFFSSHGSGLSGFQPHIEMSETDKNYQLAIDIPKGQKIDLNAELDGNTLSIDGKISSETKEEKNGGVRSSSRVSQFSQSINLPEPVNEGGMRITQQDNNKMIITVPKANA
jgi:HSP20 family protein